jgi:hypothetical protein
VKYPVTCKEAVKKNIVINTIQCGTDGECMKIWKDIAAKSEGSFAAIPAAGGVVAVATPFDKRLAEINTELTKTVVLAGTARARKEGEDKLKAARKLAPGAAADRAGFGGKTGKGAGGARGDLVEEAVKDGKVDPKKLKEVKEAELPDELKKLKTEKERVEYIKKKAEERTKLNKEALELDKKRSDYIAAELKKKGKGKDSFDASVLEILRKQAKKHEIEIK